MFAVYLGVDKDINHYKSTICTFMGTYSPLKLVKIMCMIE